MMRIVRRITGKRPFQECREEKDAAKETPPSEVAAAPCTPPDVATPRSRSRSPKPGRLHRSSQAGQARPQLRRASGLSLARRPSGIRRSLAHRASFLHRDFANPEAETCWLSCLFQSLWHSVVFHQAFDEHLRLSDQCLGPEEHVLAALQATWADYGTTTGEGEAGQAEGQPSQASLVPAEGLAEAFGEGYGDMSEALARIQDELSSSGSPEAVAIADRIVLVPLCSSDSGALPGPAEAAVLAQEWQVANSPLIAVDLTLPTPTAEECQLLADLWVPRGAEAASQASSQSSLSHSGLQSTHRLVAFVCFMWNLRHYVAFCCRQSDPSSCVFFNDLPCLTPGAPKEILWRDVPKLCSEHCLMPRLLLYESRSAAEDACRSRLKFKSD